MHNVVELTLVAMAMKFGLGTESSRLPACFGMIFCQYMFICVLYDFSVFLININEEIKLLKFKLKVKLTY